MLLYLKRFKLNLLNEKILIKKFSYIKQLDLLRAVAVLGVIFYHYTDGYFTGGWLGVDVFFVLSGFLISNTIISSLTKKNFKFKSFYIRRIRRILPSLLSTILFTVPFSFQLLAPKELIEYLRSTASSLFFISNFYLLDLDFYNTSSAKLMPMIHTWSLSIEEQFYIVFPVFMFLIYKNEKINKFLIIFIFFIVSIFIAASLSSEVAFYLPQFRMWEFLLGVILMFLYQSKKIKGSYSLGLFIILFSYIYFDDLEINNLLPRVVCLIGVSIYLLGTQSNIKEFKFEKMFITIGKISYSLYLFHQPIFSFYKIYLYKNDIYESNLSKIYLVTILFIISYLNYYLIEKKFLSSKKLINIKFFLIVYFLTAVIFFGFSSRNENLLKFNPYSNRLVIYSLKSQNIIQQNNRSCENRRISEICFFDTEATERRVYSLGDSSFRTISSLIEKEREDLQFDYFHFGGNGCLPLLYEKVADISCPENDVSEVSKFIESINNSIVIYGGRIPLYLSEEGFFNGIEREDTNIQTLVNVEYEVRKVLENLIKNNNQIILIYPIPTQGWNVPNLFFYEKFNWGDTVGYSYDLWRERSSKSKDLLDSIQSSQISRVYPENIFCQEIVDNLCVGAYQDKIFYSDDDHLSEEGAKLVSSLVIDEIQNILNSKKDY